MIIEIGFIANSSKMLLIFPLQKYYRHKMLAIAKYTTLSKSFNSNESILTVCLRKGNSAPVPSDKENKPRVYHS